MSLNILSLINEFTLNKKRKSVVLIGIVAAVCLQSIHAFEAGSSRQTTSSVENAKLEQKLAKRAKFVPQAKLPMEQLIEVAKHFKIPMGIEWVEPSSTESASLAITDESTVEDLLHAIVKRSQSHTIAIENGIVRVYAPSLSNSASNILNLRVGDFQVRNESLFDGEESLMLAIDIALHPRQYAQGYNGGYGYDLLMSSPCET